MASENQHAASSACSAVEAVATTAGVAPLNEELVVGQAVGMKFQQEIRRATWLAHACQSN